MAPSDSEQTSDGIEDKPVIDPSIRFWSFISALQERSRDSFNTVKAQHRCTGRQFDPVENTWTTQECDRDRKDFACTRALCQSCVDLAYDLYPQLDQQTLRCISTRVDSLRASTLQGCQKCAILYGAVIEAVKAVFPRKCPPRPMSDISYVQAAMFYRCTIALGNDAVVKFKILDLDFVIHSSSDQNFLSLRAFNLPFRADLGHSVSFVRKHLGTCLREHGVCASDKQRCLPKRVLDLGLERPLKSIKLLEITTPIVADYLTLSHCWGDAGLLLRTTGSTIENHFEGIDLGDLPNTFRDAVLLTEKLGYRYLWIDSLCIIQGDRFDWEVESSKMASIYSNSVLTIAATHSPDCNGGLFFDRKVKAHIKSYDNLLPTMAIQLPVTKEQVHPHILVSPDRKASHHVFTSKAWSSQFAYSSHSWKSTSHDQSPLLRRGWVLQERLLSPRLVHFHSEELVWECRKSSHCECGGIERMQSSVGMEPTLKAQFAVLTQNPNMLRDARQAHVLWRNIIETFTSLALTNESDRLPALAGIASYISPLLGGRYLAGHWKIYLIESLAWKRPLRSFKQPSCPRTQRSSIGRAIPTWSWASIRSNDSGQPQIIEWEANFVRNDRARVIDATCNVLKATEYLQVEGGSVVMEALIRPASLAYCAMPKIADAAVSVIFPCLPGSDSGLLDLSRSERFENALREGNLESFGAFHNLAGVYLDITTSREAIDEVFYIYLGDVRLRFGVAIPTALVLRKVQPGVYERIGLSESPNLAPWFDEAPVETITLI